MTTDEINTGPEDGPPKTEPDDSAGPHEAVDPELLKIPRRKRRRHPLIALAVIGLSLYVAYFLHRDFFFFFQSSRPVDVGNVATAIQHGRLRNNTYVTVHGAPDRKHSMILEGRIGGYDSFFPLLEGHNRVFVQQHRERRTTDAEIATVHTGQLVRFGNLPYADNLREFLTKSTSLAHDLSFDQVQRARGSARAILKDVHGAAVQLEPDSVLWVNAAFADEWIVQFRKQIIASEEEATRKLAELKLPHVKDEEQSRMFWRLVVHAEADQMPLLMAMRRQTRGVEVVRRQITFRVRWSQLKVQGDTLLIEAADPNFSPRYRVVGQGEQARLESIKESVVHLPRKAVLFIEASSPIQVGDDALVLLSGVSPDDKWLYLLLYIVLAGFIALNTVSLMLRLRDRS